VRKLSGALPVFAIVGQVRARFGHHFLRVGLLGFGVLALAFGLTATPRRWPFVFGLVVAFVSFAVTPL